MSIAIWTYLNTDYGFVNFDVKYLSKYADLLINKTGISDY